MEYDINLTDLKKRTLEISVINNKLNNKEKIGSVEIRLYDIEWNNNEYIKWYDLSRQIDRYRYGSENNMHLKQSTIKI